MELEASQSPSKRKSTRPGTTTTSPTTEVQKSDDPKPKDDPIGEKKADEKPTKDEAPLDQKKSTAPKPPKIERATFGGGCFWCTEAVFQRLAGVQSVVSGYAGGNIPNPTYRDVSTGLTGHAEVIQIVFDPSLISYETLLVYFFKSHDPTTLNSQGPDFGTQYRSIILFETEEQKQTALKVMKDYKEQTSAKGRSKRITTQLVPLIAFYQAEAYHQNYYQNHSDEEYSQTYIAPKLKKLKLK